MNDFLAKTSSFSPNKEQLETEVLRQEFTNFFNLEKLKQLSLDEYVLNAETHSKDSFCYWVETKLKVLGNIHGNTSFKFGVYFGKTKSDPVIKWRWTNWTNESFDTVRKAITDLYYAGKSEDIVQIKKNPLSPMFKGKILSLYFPHRYINVFTDYHLKFFLNKLDIHYGNNLDSIDLREKLIEFKNSNNETSNWTAIDFGHYLYKCFGAPSEKEVEDQRKIENESYDKILNVEVNREIISNKKGKQYEDRPVIKPEKTETPAGVTYKRDKSKSTFALSQAKFKCEVNPDHQSFIRKGCKQLYTEPHHLIPMEYQDDFDYALDVPANIVSLCSNCHNWLHYGADSDKLLKLLFDSRINRLIKSNLEISFKDLKSYYK